jgi:serine/threonine protein phosphatase PrpC
VEHVGERGGVSRYRGRDLGLSGNENIPVMLLREAMPETQAAPAAPVEATPIEAVPLAADEEILPGFDDAPVASFGPATEVLPAKPIWPSAAWESSLLDCIEHPGLPTILDTFFENGFQYVVEEIPAGQSLWDLWDDPDGDNNQRFTCLAKVAGILQTLHRLGAMIEGIRPDIIVVDDMGQPRISDLSDLLPLPVPADAPLRGTLYTAPELLATPEKADARAELYSFGAMLLALNLGHELTERQFNKPGHPKPIFNDYPDMHPALGRLMMKTFCRQPEGRFPSDEAVKEDKTGFSELIKTLTVLARTMDQCHMEIAAWTTTGMVRTGNEDAFAFLHASESRQDDFADSAILLLADGMGGYDAGEVAAAMAIAQLRKNLVALRPFNTTAGASGFPSEHPNAEGNAPPPLDVEQAKTMIKAALRDANKHVFTASRTPGVGKRGMGCTAEVVYVDGRNIVVGHVGDSRTYHLSNGELIQITRDQTLVNRLVELGTLTPEEAEDHPRKNELQQAIGGQPDVEPGVYAAKLRPGDYVLVCSDGLSNHIKDAMLRQFLKGEAVSAEMAARRLMNLVNIEGATDNATVVVVRAT